MAWRISTRIQGAEVVRTGVWRRAAVRFAQGGLGLVFGVCNLHALASEGPVERATGVVTVELNLAEPIADGCRLSFVMRNRTAHAFASLQWDLVFFNRDGLIAGRTAAEAAPLPQGKTSMKQYDVPGLACDQLQRVLLNDVMRCEAAGDAKAVTGCLQLIEPSSRAAIQFFK